MKPTLGLTRDSRSTPWRLIAPGAFTLAHLQEQALYGAPAAGASMWLGIVAALLSALRPRSAMPSSRSSIPARAPRTSTRSRPSSRRRRRSSSRALAKFFTGLGEPPLLLGLPGLHGRGDGDHRQLHPGAVLPGHVQRQLQQPAVHDPLLRRLHGGRGLHRLQGRHGHDGGEHGDQHHPDLGAPRLLGDRHRLPQRSTPTARRATTSRTGSPSTTRSSRTP